MGLLTTFKRSLGNTKKQIKRSGWLSWASIMVMTLAFFIGSIFVFLAYLSNLFLLSIENKPHIYVFFNAGTPESDIGVLYDKLTAMPEVLHIEYTDEQGAITEFKAVQERKDPQLAQNIRSNVLPASLGIRLKKIDDANILIDYLSKEKTTNPSIFAVRYSKESIDTITSLFYWLRIGGGIIIGLLIVVIFMFTLLTVEFRTFSRAEEIGIMQLVGGSLWFIRSPFVLEGAFYGMVGALVSNSLILILYFLVFYVNKDSAAVAFIVNLFGNLSWPLLKTYHYVVIFAGTIIVGSLIGAFNSLVAIRKYIN
jgi:cell division transport system permease protein